MKRPAVAHRSRYLPRLTLAACVLVLLSGCEQESDVFDADRIVPADWMTMDESEILVDRELSPGQTFEVRFREDTERDGAYVLIREDRSSWLYEFSLVPGDGSSDPTWERIDPGAASARPGRGGAGPDVLQLPPDLRPGNYAVCIEAATASGMLCSRITVSD